MKPLRISWPELRETGGEPELFFVIADVRGSQIDFSERSTWESQWYKCVPTPAQELRVKHYIDTELSSQLDSRCHLS